MQPSLGSGANTASRVPSRMSASPDCAADHAIARGLVSDLPHATLGHAKTIGQPVRFDGVKPIAPRSAPALGADGPAILARLGIAHD